MVFDFTAINQGPRAQEWAHIFLGGSAPQTPLQVGLEASEITGYIPSVTARIVGGRKPIHHKLQEYCIHIQIMLRNLDLWYAAFNPSRRDSMT